MSSSITRAVRLMSALHDTTLSLRLGHRRSVDDIVKNTFMSTQLSPKALANNSVIVRYCSCGATLLLLGLLFQPIDATGATMKEVKQPEPFEIGIYSHQVALD